MSNALDKGAFLAQNDIEIEKVDLPTPYSGHVYIKTMNGQEWDAYQESIVVEDPDAPNGRKLNFKQIRAKLVVRCLCDEHGNLLLDPDDLDSLSKKGNKVLEKLAKVAQRLNGMTEETSEKN